jgi:nicotinate-nucleotide pyrophosphorylase (carboxylating)
MVLNSMQRMSAIATKTIVLSLKKEQIQKILDTRKTTPGFRVAEKWAVKLGGRESPVCLVRHDYA